MPSPCLQFPLFTVKTSAMCATKNNYTSTWSVRQLDSYVRKVFWCMGAVHKDSLTERQTRTWTVLPEYYQYRAIPRYIRFYNVYIISARGRLCG